MIRVIGAGVLVASLYVLMVGSHPNAGSLSTNLDLANRLGFYGVMTLGVGVLIIAGGIDLSIGSVVGLAAVLFGVLMERGVPPLPAVIITLLAGAVIGYVQGELVTRLKLQAFLVTLCGLFIFRGLARQLTTSPVGIQKVKGLHPEFAKSLESLQFWLSGVDAERDNLEVFPAQFVVLLLLAAVVGVVLHKTVYGRYWFAIGYNEQAAKYAGINVERSRLAAFVLCSTLAALAGILLLLSSGSAMPDNAGQSLELYAIAGAVLGGCSLRGGEGNIIGIVLGAAILPLIYKIVTFRDIGDAVIPSIVGGTLLFGVIFDEALRRGQGWKSVLRLFKP